MKSKSVPRIAELCSTVLTDRVTADETRALSLLFADFLACVKATPATTPQVADGDRNLLPTMAGGIDGVITELVIRSSLEDRDDIDWRGQVHPGSIVWPVALGLGAAARSDADRILDAVAKGYRATTALAELLGPELARRHHSTAIAGAFGAAIAACTILGMSPDQTVAAGSHAISASGGLGQAGIERSRSLVFHRVTAATVGLQAARFARCGFSASALVLEGARGAVRILGGGEERSLERLDFSPTGASVRIYPTNGFAQAAVHLAAREGAKRGGVLVDGEQIIVRLRPEVAVAVTSEYGGDWWDIRFAAAAAFTSQDPFALGRTPAALQLRERVSVQTGDIRSGFGALAVANIESNVAEEALEPLILPGAEILSEPTRDLLAQKWRHLLGSEQAASEVSREASSTLVSGDLSARTLLLSLGIDSVQLRRFRNDE